MKKEHREILRELMNLCHDLGGETDATATNVNKYIDRQRAHMSVCWVLYAILTDSPDNEARDDNFKTAYSLIKHMGYLKSKEYPDKNGRP